MEQEDKVTPEVKRYEFHLHRNAKCSDFVLYSDHSRIVAELEAGRIAWERLAEKYGSETIEQHKLLGELGNKNFHLEADNKRLRELLERAMGAIDVDNLTTQTLYRELSQALEATQ
jgi:hypothetical protein